MTNRILQYLEMDPKAGPVLPSLDPRPSGYSETIIHADAMAFRFDGNDYSASAIDAHLRQTEEIRAGMPVRCVTLEFTGDGVRKDGENLVLTSPSALDAMIKALVRIRQVPAAQRIFDQMERDRAAFRAAAAEERPAETERTFDVDAEDDDDRGDDWAATA